MSFALNAFWYVFSSSPFWLWQFYTLFLSHVYVFPVVHFPKYADTVNPILFLFISVNTWKSRRSCRITCFHETFSHEFATAPISAVLRRCASWAPLPLERQWIYWYLASSHWQHRKATNSSSSHLSLESVLQRTYRKGIFSKHVEYGLQTWTSWQ